jgi:hypothetical protein
MLQLANMAIKADKYRWIGLAGIFLILLSHWADFTFSAYLDPLARLLLLTFAFLYWKDHKDIFAVILLVAISIIFLLSIATLTQLYVTHGLI